MHPWVVVYWLNYWFMVRHVGVPGHTPEQCRRHARFYVKEARRLDKPIHSN